MKQHQSVISSIEYLKEIVSNQDFQKNNKTDVKHFARKRKLSYEDVMFFVLGLNATTLGFETEQFNTVSGIDTLSTAAICKARDKIPFEAFHELLRLYNTQIKPIQLFREYRLLAIDGTCGELPKTPALTKKYPGSNSGYPQFHATAMVDILNGIFLDAEFLPAPANEREACCQLMKRHPFTQKEILLFDRGYPSIEVIQQLNMQGRKYVMRVSKSFLKEVNEFVASEDIDKNVTIDYQKKRYRKSNKEMILPYLFDLRCVKIPIGGENTEYLITNLPVNEFTTADIGELYRMRWQIETHYNYLKNAVMIESFCSKKENSIKQEFYAALIRYNLNSQVTAIATEKMKQGDLSKK